MRGRVAIVTMITAGITTIGPLATAQATDEITQNAVGVYTLGLTEDKPTNKWVLTPCDNDAPRCVKVSQYWLKDTAMNKPTLTGTAYWTVGSWFMTTDWPNLVRCEDGTATTLPVSISWDAATGDGNRSYNDPGLCGKEPKAKSSPIFLRRIGAAPAPAAAPTPMPAGPPAPAAPPAAAVPPAPAVPLPPPGAAESPVG